MTTLLTIQSKRLTDTTISIPQVSIGSGYDYMIIQSTMTTTQLQTTGWTLTMTVNVSFDNGVTWSLYGVTASGGPQNVGRFGNPPRAPGLALTFDGAACLLTGSIQITGTLTCGAVVQTSP